MAGKPTYEELEQRIKELEKAEAERGQTEEALLESEEKYRMLFEHSGFAITLIDAETGERVAFNREAYERLGYSNEEFKDSTSLIVDAEKLPKDIMDHHKRIMEEGSDLFETKQKTKSGEVRDVLVSAVAVKIGKRYFINNISTDITKRKQTEETLRESEELFKHLSESSPIGIFQTDRDGSVLYVNNKWLNITRMSHQDALGFGWVQAMHPEDQPRVLSEWAKCLEEKRGYDGEFRFVRPSGEIRWVHTCTSPVFSPGGDVVTHVGTNEDITDRKQAEEALRESEEEYRNLYDQAPVGYMEYNIEGNLIRVNQRELEMLGYTAEEMLGKPVWNFVVEKGEARKIIKAKLTDDKPPSKNLVRTYIRKDGTTLPCLIDDSVLKDKAGRVLGIRATIQDITERMRIEEALQDSESMMRSIFRAAPIGIGIVVDRILQDVNTLFCSITGYSRNELIGKSSRIVYPTDEDYEYVGREKYKQIQKKGTGTVETTLKRKDGKIIDVILSSTPLDPNDLSAGVAFTVLDITERKSAEKALLESENKWRNVLVNTPQIGVSINPEARITFANAHFLELTQWDEEEVIGKDWFEMFIPESIRQEVRNVFSETMRKKNTEGLSNYENQILTKSGELRHVFWSNVITKDSDGQIVDVTSLGIDLTDIELAREEVRESNLRLELVLDSVRDAVWDWRVDAQEVYFSPRWYTMLGYEPYELPESFETWKELLHPDDSSYAEETVFQHLELAKPFELEFRMKTKDDQWKWILARGKTVEKDDQGKALRMLGTHMDITERKNLEAQLQQAQKMESIGTLAGGIAHDFNNILSPIMIHSELAVMDIPSDSPTQQNLKEILKASERARELVKQILTFSRKADGKRASIKITPIIKESFKLIRSSIPTTIDMQQNLEAESDTILADPTQIHQIILNLATNSAYAMREKGGILEVNLTQEDLYKEAAVSYIDLAPGSYLKLTVRDTGSGMDDETIQKIFEPYYTTKAVGEGTGMGLAMVHGIVKSYGGIITVESELGIGTTFNVYLPRVEDTSSGAEPSVQPPKGSERVLFVDDELSAVSAMQPMLENLGYQVTARTSSIEALEAFRNNPEVFDLIITDMTMPNMTGKELAKEVLAIRADMPIILCTGFSEQIDGEKAKAMGISSFLMKPIRMYDIANTIREVLDKK